MKGRKRKKKKIRPASPSATAQEKESCWILLLLAPAAVGLRSARQCALRGAAAVDPAAAAGLLEQRTFCRATRTADLLPGCFRFSSVRFRPLPRPEAVYHSAVLQILKSVKVIINHGKMAGTNFPTAFFFAAVACRRQRLVAIPPTTAKSTTAGGKIHRRRRCSAGRAP